MTRIKIKEACIDCPIKERCPLVDEIGSELCDAVIDPRGKAIRLIKAYKGEKYLKENEWLGYNTHMSELGTLRATAEKNSSEYKDLIDDARSNGMRVDAPVYEQTPHKTIQSSQDEFEPEEDRIDQDRYLHRIVKNSWASNPQMRRLGILYSEG